MQLLFSVDTHQSDKQKTIFMYQRPHMVIVREIMHNKGFIDYHPRPINNNIK